MVKTWPDGRPLSVFAYSAYAYQPVRSLRTTVRQSPRALGRTHASSVMPEVSRRDALSLTFTRAEPLNDSALLNLPAVDHTVLLRLPPLPLPDWSAVVVPVPSSKP